MLSFLFLTPIPKVFMPAITGFPPLGLSVNAAMDIPCATSRRHNVLMSCINKGSFTASTKKIE